MPRDKGSRDEKRVSLGLGYGNIGRKFADRNSPDRLINQCDKFMRKDEKSTEISLTDGKSVRVREVI